MYRLRFTGKVKTIKRHKITPETAQDQGLIYIRDNSICKLFLRNRQIKAMHDGRVWLIPKKSVIKYIISRCD